MRKRVRLWRPHLPGELNDVLGYGERYGPQLRALRLPEWLGRVGLRSLSRCLCVSGYHGEWQGKKGALGCMYTPPPSPPP